MRRSERLLDKGEAATYRVRYPSGRSFDITGVFCGVWLDGTSSPAVKTAGGNLAILDPRAIISRSPDVLVYEPRQNNFHSSPMRSWLAAHPEWPGNLA